MKIQRSKKVKWKWETFLDEATPLEIDIEIERQIKQINSNFQIKIDNFNKKYPKAIQDRFSDKVKRAEKVIAWWTDKYITRKAEHFNITPLVFAEWIINKADLFEDFFLKAENERDTLIANLSN